MPGTTERVGVSKLMGMYRVYICEIRRVRLFFHLELKDTSKRRCSATAKAPLVSSPGGGERARGEMQIESGSLCAVCTLKILFCHSAPKIGARRLMTVARRRFKTATKLLTVCCFEPPLFR